jgi:hypothetical protein
MRAQKTSFKPPLIFTQALEPLYTFAGRLIKESRYLYCMKTNMETRTSKSGTERNKVEQLCSRQTRYEYRRDVIYTGNYRLFPFLFP